MTFAYIGQGVYMPSITPKFYVINTNINDYIIIDSSDGEYNQIINNILEITRGVRPKYLILTSCKRSSAGGAALISKFFEIPIVAHYPDSVNIRYGTCENENYSSSRISIELREKIRIFEGLKIINSKTPTLGSVIIKWRNFLFTGNNKITALGNEIKYVCDILECKKV